jgi:hypothetical protein
MSSAIDLYGVGARTVGTPPEQLARLKEAMATHDYRHAQCPEATRHAQVPPSLSLSHSLTLSLSLSFSFSLSLSLTPSHPRTSVRSARKLDHCLTL